MPGSVAVYGVLHHLALSPRSLVRGHTLSILLNFCLVENAMSQMGEEGGGERFGEECTDLTMELLAEDGGEFTFFFFF